MSSLAYLSARYPVTLPPAPYHCPRCDWPLTLADFDDEGWAICPRCCLEVARADVETAQQPPSPFHLSTTNH